MFLHKSILVGMITFPLFPGVALADPNSAALEITIQALRQCYEVEHKTEAEVAICMNERIRQNPNLIYFQAHLSGDIPGDLELLVYNHAGYTTKCALYAGRIIELRQCVNYQATPLTNSQELSITPPNE